MEDAEKIIPEMVEKIAKYSNTLKMVKLARDMKNDWVKEYGPVIIFRKIWEQIGLNLYLQKQ